MNKIEKFLRKLPNSQREKVFTALSLIENNMLQFLDCKKLEGSKETYRVRIGSIRIKFSKSEGLNKVIEMGWRSDNTY